MESSVTGIEAWEALKSTIEAKIAECRLMLDRAYDNAEQTFSERLLKVQSTVLVKMLNESKNDLSQNCTATRKQLDFCLTMLRNHDALLHESASRIREPTGQGTTPFDQALRELANASEWESSAKIAVTTTKMVSKPLFYAPFWRDFLVTRRL